MRSKDLLILALLGLCWRQVAATGNSNSTLCLATSSQALLTALLNDTATLFNNTDVLRQQVQKGLAGFSACLGFGVLGRPLSIMVPLLGTVALWSQRAKQFTARTGIEIRLDTINPFYQVGAEILFELSNSNDGLHDAWIFDPSITGGVAQLGGFADLGPFIREDAANEFSEFGLQFSDYSRFYREVAGVYNGTIIGLPMDGDLMLMYYRQDLFTRYNKRVPQTWDDFLQLAREMNGTDTDNDGKPDLYGACFDNQPVCKGSFLVCAVEAPYLQYKGTSQGFFFDPDPENPAQGAGGTPLGTFVDSPAMAATLEFFRSVMPYSAPMNCSGANWAFQTGRCLMTINWADEFRATRPPSLVAAPGTVGIARLPGSKRVLDRRTRTLIDCDPSICPYALPYLLPNGTQSGWVNYAPFPAFGGWTGGVNAHAPLEAQRAAFQFFAFVTSPENSWEDVLNPAWGIDPFRDSHLNPANIDKWTDAGYDPTLTLNFLQVVKESLESRNVALDTRLAYDPSRNGYRLPLEWALMNVTTLGFDTAGTMAKLQAEYTLDLSLAVQKIPGKNPLELQRQYWGLLSYERPTTNHQIGGSDSSSGLSVRERAAAIGVSLGVGIPLLLLLAWGLLLLSRQDKYHTLTGKIIPPGAGPATTLVITDIQDSTTLYEALPDHVMDRVMASHNTLARKLLRKHAGYESATEGDSFIIAFHTPANATLFCMELQEELLQVSWPQELLSCPAVPSAHPVFVTPTAQEAEVLAILGVPVGAARAGPLGATAAKAARHVRALATSNAHGGKHNAWISRLLARLRAPHAQPSSGLPLSNGDVQQFPPVGPAPGAGAGAGPAADLTAGSSMSHAVARSFACASVMQEATEHGGFLSPPHSREVASGSTPLPPPPPPVPPAPTPTAAVATSNSPAPPGEPTGNSPPHANEAGPSQQAARSTEPEAVPHAAAAADRSSSNHSSLVQTAHTHRACGSLTIDSSLLASIGTIVPPTAVPGGTSEGGNEGARADAPRSSDSKRGRRISVRLPRIFTDNGKAAASPTRTPTDCQDNDEVGRASRGAGKRRGASGNDELADGPSAVSPSGDSTLNFAALMAQVTDEAVPLMRATGSTSVAGSTPETRTPTGTPRTARAAAALAPAHPTLAMSARAESGGLPCSSPQLPLPPLQEEVPPVVARSPPEVRPPASPPGGERMRSWDGAPAAAGGQGPQVLPTVASAPIPAALGTDGFGSVQATVTNQAADPILASSSSALSAATSGPIAGPDSALLPRIRTTTNNNNNNSTTQLILQLASGLLTPSHAPTVRTPSRMFGATSLGGGNVTALSTSAHASGANAFGPWGTGVAGSSAYSLLDLLVACWLPKAAGQPSSGAAAAAAAVLLTSKDASLYGGSSPPTSLLVGTPPTALASSSAAAVAPGVSTSLAQVMHEEQEGERGSGGRASYRNLPPTPSTHLAPTSPRFKHRSALTNLLMATFDAPGSPAVGAGAAKAPVLVLQGLRIRCALAGGVESAADVVYNASTATTQYRGKVMERARRVAGAAQGAQVLLSQEVFSGLPHDTLRSVALVLHMGEHELEGAPEDTKMTAPAHLYSAVPLALAPRLVLLPPLRTRRVLVSGALCAPLGACTVAFMHVVGVRELRAWDARITGAMLETYLGIAAEELAAHEGYLVEQVDGFVLALFASPLAALHWALAVEMSMRHAAWPQRLLHHALCEEIVISTPATLLLPGGSRQTDTARAVAHGVGGGGVPAPGGPHTQQPLKGGLPLQATRTASGTAGSGGVGQVVQQVVLFRGPRLKVGIDCGALRGELGGVNGRMNYRGKPMNRAARIGAGASSGQVLCSADAWHAACAMVGAPKDSLSVASVTASRLGSYLLKGIPDKIEIYQLRSELPSPLRGNSSAATALFGSGMGETGL